jgi:hypothetical protein
MGIKETGDSNFSEITTATGFSHKEAPTAPTDYRVSIEAKVCPSKSETLHVEIEEPTIFPSTFLTILCA